MLCPPGSAHTAQPSLCLRVWPPSRTKMPDSLAAFSRRCRAGRPPPAFRSVSQCTTPTERKWMPGNQGTNAHKDHDWWTEGSSDSPTGRPDCTFAANTTGAFTRAFRCPRQVTCPGEAGPARQSTSVLLRNPYYFKQVAGLPIAARPSVAIRRARPTPHASALVIDSPGLESNASS